MRTSEYKGDPAMDFAGSSRPSAFSDDDSDVDAYDFQLRGSCSFNFHPEQPQSSPSRRKERVSFNETLISLIEHKMKDHNDKVLHAVEGFGARLSQLETRTLQLEKAVEDMKESLEYNHGKTDGKLRELENLLREVQLCTRDLRDKEDIAQAQLQILQLQILKCKAQEKKENSAQTNLGQQKAAAETRQSAGPLPVPVFFSQQFLSPLPYVSTDLAHSNASTIPLGTLPQLSSQLAQHIRPFVSLPEWSSRPPTPPLQNSHQQPHTPLVSHLQPMPSVPYFPSSPAVPYPSEPAPTPQDFGLPLSYSAVASQTHLHDKYYKPLVSHSHLTPQGPPPSSSALQVPPKPVPTPQDFGLPLPHNVPSAPPHHEPTHDPNEFPYIPSQDYPQSSYALPGMPFISSHQLQTPFTKTYDQLPSRPFSELLGRCTSAGGSSNFYNIDPRGRYNSGHSNSSARTSSPPAPGMGNDYSQLPVARILPDALPTASAIGPELTSVETRGNGVLMDDVIDKAVAMGFRRDLVRATANRLKANGQHPDLNLLLDTLVSTGESR